MENRGLEKAYHVKPIEVLERNRMSRQYSVVGFPYISFNGVEILKLGYAMKVLHRDSVVISLFDNQKKSYYAQVNGANKALLTLRDKGYIEIVSAEQQQGFLYTLTDQAFEFLRENPFSKDWERWDLNYYFALNRVFSNLSREYRYEYEISWLVDPNEGHSASCIIWEDRKQGFVKESMVIEILKERMREKQVEEIDIIVKKHKNKDWKEFPSRPSIYVVDPVGEYELKRVG